MSFVRLLCCDGCQSNIPWTGRPAQALMEAQARKLGWQAPDKLGRHWCPECRRPDGRPRR